MHYVESFLLQALDEVLCVHHPAQAESRFAEGDTEALRLGDSFEATSQKDAKLNFQHRTLGLQGLCPFGATLLISKVFITDPALGF